MEASENRIVESYLSLLQRLSPRLKLNLIERLTKSVQSEFPNELTMSQAFGTWKSEESAEELIAQLRSDRNTDRQIEGL